MNPKCINHKSFSTMLAVKSMDKRLHLNQNRPNKQSLINYSSVFHTGVSKGWIKILKIPPRICKLKRGKQFSAGTIVNINVNIITCPASQMLFHVYYETGNYSKQAHHYAKN